MIMNCATKEIIYQICFELLLHFCNIDYFKQICTINFVKLQYNDFRLWLCLYNVNFELINYKPSTSVEFQVS